MFKLRSFIPTLAVLLVCLAGAAFADDATLLGTGLGAAAGGVIGSDIGRGGGRPAAIGVGVITGGVVGNEIGQSIDNSNRSTYPLSIGPTYYSTNDALFSDTSPYSSYSPNYVAPPAPPPTYIDNTAGTYCRPYSQRIIVNGQVQESYGTACLQPDGTWRPVN